MMMLSGKDLSRVVSNLFLAITVKSMFYISNSYYINHRSYQPLLVLLEVIITLHLLYLDITYG